MTLVDSGTGKAGIDITASFGHASNQNINTAISSVSDGLFTTNQPHGLTGQNNYIVFTAATTIPFDGLEQLKLGFPYRVSAYSSNQLKILDYTQQQLVGMQTKGQSTFQLAPSLEINDGVVTTAIPHHYSPGDQVTFYNLPANSNDVANDTTYVVVAAPTPTTFTFATQKASTFPITTAQALSGQVAVPLMTTGGFSLGGAASIQLQLPSADDPTTQLTITGNLSGSYNSGNKVTGSFNLQLGAGDSSSPGITINWDADGHRTVPNWSFAVTRAMSWKQAAADANPMFTASGSLTIQHTENADGSEDTGYFGDLALTIPKLNFSGTLNLGQGTTDGIVHHVNADGKHYLKSMDFTLQIDRLKPNAAPLFKSVQLYGLQVDATYLNNATDGSDFQDFVLDLGGSVILAVGDSTPDANGDWKTQPATITVATSADVIQWDRDAIHLNEAPGLDVKLAINGTFKVGGEIDFQANNLFAEFSIPLDGSDPFVEISGGISLPQLGGAGISLGSGDGTGLRIDTKTHKFQLDGFKLKLPTLGTSGFKVQGVTIAFSLGDSDGSSASENWDLGVTGTLVLGGTSVSIELDLGEKDGKFVVNSIGAQVRGLSPGIALGSTGGFLTDIGLKLDNINTGNRSGTILLGGTLGGKTVNVGGKDYAILTFTATGKLSMTEFDIDGTLQVVGGILGTVTADLDFNWGIGSYSLNAEGQFLYGALDGTLIAEITPQVIAGLFDVKLKVPSVIPLIGGKTLAEGGAMLFIERDGSDSYVAAWGTVFDRWTAGFKYDFHTDHFSFIGGSEVKSLKAQLPGDLASHPFTYTQSFDTTDAGESAVPLGAMLADADKSPYSTGAFRVKWDGIDKTGKVFVTFGGNASVQVWGNGADGKPIDTSKPIVDAANGVTYTIKSDSVTGDIGIQVLPQNPTGDVYQDLIPAGAYTVTLSTDEQMSQDLTSEWSGYFTAPPPEVSSSSVAQPLGDALGALDDEQDPNLATVTYAYRSSDPATTQIDFYYDYDATGYNGIKFDSVKGSTLLAAAPDTAEQVSDAQTVTLDLRNLPPVPVYVYAIIYDAQHAPITVPYALDATGSATGGVRPHPQVAAFVQLPQGGTPDELSNWGVTYTPVTQFTVASLAGGTVTTSSPLTLKVGDKFVFHGLSNPQNVANDQPYYVAGFDANAKTFTFAATPGGPAIFTAAADAGAGAAYYTDPDVLPQLIPTYTTGGVSLNPGVAGWYAVSIAPKNYGYTPTPANGQAVGPDGGLVQYVQVTDLDAEIDVYFGFDRDTVISGRVLNDHAAGGTSVAPLPGAGGVTVYLDDNGNGLLDAGEASTLTDPDGNYHFVYSYPTGVSTYTTAIRQLPRFGWTVEQADGKAGETIAVPAITKGTQFVNKNFLDLESAVLSGTVFDDADKDGAKDEGEAGVPNVPVTIQGPNGSSATATTGVDGTWTYSTPVRGQYEVSVTPPGGATVTKPYEPVPSLTGQTPSNDFPYQSTWPLNLTTALSYRLDPSTNAYEYNVGFYGLVIGKVGDLYIDQITNQGAGPVASQLWTSTNTGSTTNQVSDTVSDVVSGASPGQNLVFGVVERNGFTTTDLVQINPDKSTLEIPVISGEQFTAWPHLTAAGGLASVDPAGNVFSWSGDAGGYKRNAIAHTAGNAADIATFEAGVAPGEPETMAVLYASNGQTFVQMISVDTSDTTKPPIGIVDTPFTVPGNVGISITAGDFNNDGIQDLATLTADAVPNGLSRAPVNWTVTFLINDGKGNFDEVSTTGHDALYSRLPVTYGRSQLQTMSVLGTGGDQLAWGTFGPLKNSNISSSTTRLATVTGVANGSLVVNVAATNQNETYQIGVLHAPGAPPAFGSGAGGTMYHFLGGAVDTLDGLPNLKQTVTPVIRTSYTIPADWTQSGGPLGGLDFGLNGGTLAAGPGQVAHGVAYNDYDNNGQQDVGEDGIGGLPVQVVTPNADYRFEAFAGDADSGISSAKTYTHALDFAAGGPTVVNGVTFAAAGTSGTTAGGATWSYTGYDSLSQTKGFPTPNVTGFKNNLVGGTETLAETFYYSSVDGEQLTLGGLTPGTTYTTTFYCVGYTDADRTQSISDSEGGVLAGFDEDQFGSGNGLLLRRTFTASSTSITFTFLNHAGNAFHQYAMTNEVVPTQATVGYSTAAFTGDADSGIAAAKTYTHALNTAGPALTINGVPFAAGPQPGNASYSFYTYDAANGHTSPMNGLGGVANNLTGDIGTATQDFFYSGPGGGEFVTLAGLTPGAFYTTTFYAVGYDAPGNRVQKVNDSLGGTFTFDQDAEGKGNGLLVRRTFQATGTSISFAFAAADGASSFHQYALTNEVVPTNGSSGGYDTAALTGDADTGISARNTYTHAVNLNGPALTVNGVPFTAGGQPGSPNYSLYAYNATNGQTSAMASLGGVGNNVTGAIGTAAQDFFYSGAPGAGERLTLTGLTPGAFYTTTFYAVGYDAPGGRVETVTDSQGGAFAFDQDAYGRGNGLVVRKTFRAAGNAITFTFAAADGGSSFHQYAFTNQVVAGGFGVSAFNGDADSGVSMAKTYTHAVDLNGAMPTTTVNGVSFVQGGTDGANYHLKSFDPDTGAPFNVQSYSDFDNQLVGEMGSLTSNFLWLGRETLQLTGLTAGTWYTTTFYCAGFDQPGDRIQTVTDDLGGTLTFDEDQFGQGNGLLLKRTFLATSDSITYTFAPAPDDNSFHQYGFTNEVSSAPTISPGDVETTTTSDGSDGRTPGSFIAPLGTSAGAYVRPDVPSGANLTGGEPMRFTPDDLDGDVPGPLGGSVATVTADLQGNGTRATAYLSGRTIQIRLNGSGSGTSYLSADTGLAPLGAGTMPDLAAADVNGDGLLDLVAAGHGGLSVLLGGSFATART